MLFFLFFSFFYLFYYFFKTLYALWPGYSLNGWTDFDAQYLKRRRLVRGSAFTMIEKNRFLTLAFNTRTTKISYHLELPKPSIWRFCHFLYIRYCIIHNSKLGKSLANNEIMMTTLHVMTWHHAINTMTWPCNARLPKPSIWRFCHSVIVIITVIIYYLFIWNKTQ